MFQEENKPHLAEIQTPAPRVWTCRPGSECSYPAAAWTTRWQRPGVASLLASLPPSRPGAGHTELQRPDHSWAERAAAASAEPLATCWGHTTCRREGTGWGRQELLPG